MKRVVFLSLIILTGLFTANAQTVLQLSPAEKQQFLEAHNKIRQQVGAPALTWSNELENYAKQWALMMAKTQKFQHSPTSKYGENIFKSTYPPKPQDVVVAWAQEGKYYHNEPITLDNYWIFGHYTQIIWAKTTQLGCAIAKGSDGTYYVVCEYFPAGNVIGKKPTDQ